MKTFPQGVSVTPTVTSNEETEVLSHKGEDNDDKEQNMNRNQKRLLPDRSHAAHNRANGRLVNFIVNQRMVEKRLLVGYTRNPRVLDFALVNWLQTLIVLVVVISL